MSFALMTSSAGFEDENTWTGVPGIVVMSHLRFLAGLRDNLPAVSTMSERKF